VILFLLVVRGLVALGLGPAPVVPVQTKG
jgi:hypothetical protein